MQKVINNTPVSVLLDFLKSIKNYDKIEKRNYRVMDVTVKTAFCEILEIEEKNLFGTISEYLSLITIVKRQVSTNFRNKDRYLIQLEEIQRTFIVVGLESDITEFQKLITDVIINTLELCSDGLEEREEIIKVTQEQLEDIQNQIAELSSQLEYSSLPKKLVAVLLHKLDEIEEAVKRYKRWGINEFEAVYDSLLGGLYKNRKSIDAVENKGFLQKIAVFMKTLSGFTSTGKDIVQNAIETTEKITDFLE